MNNHKLSIPLMFAVGVLVLPTLVGAQTISKLSPVPLNKEYATVSDKETLQDAKAVREKADELIVAVIKDEQQSTDDTRDQRMEAEKEYDEALSKLEQRVDEVQPEVGIITSNELDNQQDRLQELNKEYGAFPADEQYPLTDTVEEIQTQFEETALEEKPELEEFLRRPQRTEPAPQEQVDGLAEELDEAISEIFKLRSSLDEVKDTIIELKQENKNLKDTLREYKNPTVVDEVREENIQPVEAPVRKEIIPSDAIETTTEGNADKLNHDSRYVGKSDDGFEGETYQVRMKYLRFIPGGELTVPSGSRVRFVNEDKSQYNLTFSDGTESGILEPGQEYDYIPSGTVIVDSLINPDSVSELKITIVTE